MTGVARAETNCRVGPGKGSDVPTENFDLNRKHGVDKDDGRGSDFRFTWCAEAGDGLWENVADIIEADIRKDNYDGSQDDH